MHVHELCVELERYLNTEQRHFQSAPIRLHRITIHESTAGKAMVEVVSTKKQQSEAIVLDHARTVSISCTLVGSRSVAHRLMFPPAAVRCLCRTISTLEHWRISETATVDN